MNERLPELVKREKNKECNRRKLACRLGSGRKRVSVGVNRCQSRSRRSQREAQLYLMLGAMGRAKMIYAKSHSCPWSPQLATPSV